MTEIIAGAIFVLTLAAIFAEKIHRTTIAVCGAVLMVLAGRVLGFYGEPEALAAVDVDTLGLLLGMMILVAMLEPTGFFQLIAVWAGRVSQGSPVRLLFLLGLVTTVLSMLLANVTTVVLVAPATILICEILGIPAVPYLVAEALLANIGGVATLIGDPPNILIANAAGLSFNDFLVHSLPLVSVVWLAAFGIILLLFRRELAVRPAAPGVVAGLNPAETVHDPATAKRVLAVLCAAILLFLLEDRLQVSPAFIALAAAAAAMIWVQPPVEKMLARIEWGVLLFFTALFVLVGGLEATNLLDLATGWIAGLRGIPAPAFGIAVIWVIAVLSALVDNIPITIALIPVVQGLGRSGMSVGPLWWALAFGAGLGGNGTIVGSTANVIVASLSERTRTPITAKLWNRRGLPVMLATCAVISILYLLMFPYFPK